MQPLTLTLKGFRGVRAGLGLDVLTLDFERLADDAELVAIAGANGRGKSTVLDNMHPYLIMPSRATAGAGGFSFYDHVYLPESEKELLWAHEGRSFRSQVVIRMTGRRRIEAFLFALDDSGRWVPDSLPDGTQSDGKIDSYNRCVEARCGHADTFFTSVFSAQSKRQFSAYRNAEIKTLLADLLGQEQIQALGHQASETARLLKAGLVVMRHTLSDLDQKARSNDLDRKRLADVEVRAEHLLADRHVAQAKLDGARMRYAQRQAEYEQSSSVHARRAQLLEDRDAVVSTASDATESAKVQDDAEQQRLVQLEQRITQRLAQESLRRQALQKQYRQCLVTLERETAVRRAIQRLPLAEHIVSLREAQVETLRARVSRLAACQGAEALLTQQLSAIEREAGQVILKADELKHRFGLTNEVPCSGMDLQGQCQLLGDAREAKVLIPSALGAIRRLADEKAALLEQAAPLRSELDGLRCAPQRLAWAGPCAARVRSRASRYALLAAKEGEIAQARAALAQLEPELVALPAEDEAEPSRLETKDEQGERRQIASAREAIASQCARHATRCRAALERLDLTLAALPAAFDDRLLVEAKAAIRQAAQSATAAEQAYLKAVRDAEALATAVRQHQELSNQRAELIARIAAVEARLGDWNLFARCMSNDGLIALAIDDAGPALAGLTNDLLLACYGSRFTVSLHTLVATGKGEKESFDVMVHDGDSGESKRMALMSGGERVWINECLVRAVALYLSQHTERQYDTLFSDETDGPLDLEHKRMFMQTKREVLRLGGYRREYFVSQTPELTAMADTVIDLDAWAARSAERSPAALSQADDELPGASAALPGVYEEA